MVFVLRFGQQLFEAETSHKMIKITYDLFGPIPGQENPPESLQLQSCCRSNLKTWRHGASDYSFRHSKAGMWDVHIWLLYAFVVSWWWNSDFTVVRLVSKKRITWIWNLNVLATVTWLNLWCPQNLPKSRRMFVWNVWNYWIWLWWKRSTHQKKKEGHVGQSIICHAKHSWICLRHPEVETHP